MADDDLVFDGVDGIGDIRVAGGPEVSGEVDVSVGSGASKRKCLLVLLVGSGLWGFLGGVLPEDSTFMLMLDIFMNIFILVGMLAWCYLDAEERDFTISRSLSIILFLLAVIGFPYYVLRTRKGGAVYVTLGWMVLFVMLVYFVFWIGYELGFLVYNAIYV